VELLSTLWHLVSLRWVAGLANRLLRWKWPPERVAENFSVEPKFPRGLKIVLQGPSSWVDLSLRMVNLSPLWVEIEQIDVELQVGGMLLYKDQILRRERFPRHSVFPPFTTHETFGSPTFYLRLEVEAGRAAAIEAQKANWHTSYEVLLKLDLYGQCQTGRFKKEDLRFEIPLGVAGLS